MISNKIEANNPLHARLQVMRAYIRAYEQFALSMHAALTNCSQLLRKDVPIGTWIGALVEINGAGLYRPIRHGWLPRRRKDDLMPTAKMGYSDLEQRHASCPYAPLGLLVKCTNAYERLRYRMWVSGRLMRIY